MSTEADKKMKEMLSKGTSDSFNGQNIDKTDNGNNSSSGRGILESPPSGGSSTVRRLTEMEQIEAIERMSNVNFIFSFGAAQRGKTVVTSSIIYFLHDEQNSEGRLEPFNLQKKSADHGHELYQKILNTLAQRDFPERTVLVNNQSDPIYVNVKFTPNNQRDKKEIYMTFLEMPGDTLQKIHSPSGGYGELPSSIDVFFRANKTSISFILVTDHENASRDDSLMNSFIDYIRSQNKEFSSARFLLLVTKWDTYDGGLPIHEFVQKNMKLTYHKLHNSDHSISSFSIGTVIQVADEDTSDGKKVKKDALKEYDHIPAKMVVNWIHKNVTGRPMYERTFLQKLMGAFKKYV